MAKRLPVVLVTGVSSGIGRAVANRFADSDFEVFGTSRNPSPAMADAGVQLLALDVTDPSSVSAAVSTVIDKTGRIDVLVNNAGVGMVGAAEESSDEQIRQIFETNFFGLVRVTREVLPHLRDQGSGRIINIGSVLGFLPAPYSAYYAATKHAVDGYSESLDHETREFGVRVSVVEPAYTRTLISAQALEADSPVDAYAVRRAKARQLVAEQIAAGDDPAVVARVVHKVATSRRPRRRYPAGPTAQRLVMLKKFAPAAVLDRGIRQASGLTTG